MKCSFSSRMRVVFSLAIGATLTAAAWAQQPSSTPAQPSPAPDIEHAATSSVVVPPHIQEVRKALTGMLVAIDPATGTLRAPDADEVEALTGSAASARFAPPPSIDLPGGGSVVRSGPLSVDLLTATRRADGSLVFTCAHGIDAASETFAKDHRRSTPEARDDR